MEIICIFGKLAALVALGVGIILKLIGDFAVGVSGPWLRIIAMFLFVIAIVCRIFSVADWGQSGALIAVSFIVFTLPTIGDWLTSFVESVNHRLWRFIRR